MQRIFLCIAVSLFLSFIPALAEPQPGDLFREYGYLEFMPNNGLWRIGYKWNTINGKVMNVGDVDLDKAIKAEALIEKVLCHTDTRGLAIKFNGNDWHVFPEAKDIPEPQWKYQHHTFPEVEIPISELKATGNTMEITVENTSSSAQNLTYGAMLRVYYSEDKSTLRGSITEPASGATVAHNPKVACSVQKAGADIDKVQFVGFYEDYNNKGDGNYRQWQYRWYKHKMQEHMGTAAASPYEITWQNEWIPDQPGPMKFAARIIDKDGLIYMTPAADNLTLKRNYSVELCKPDPASIPQAWVTRKGVKGEEFSVGGDLTKATSALSKVVVWQHQGIALQYTFGTGEKVTCNESKTPNVVAKAAVPAKALTQGKNTLKTQGTESGHHGVEVQWPGVVILVRYSEPTKTINNLHFAAKPLINVPANMTASQLSLMAHSGMKIYSVTGSGKTVGSTSDIPNGTYIIHLPDNTCRHVTVLQQ